MSSQILNDEPLTIFGDGSQTRAFSYDSTPPIIAPRALQHASPVKPAMRHGHWVKPAMLRPATPVWSDCVWAKPRLSALHCTALHCTARYIDDVAPVIAKSPMFQNAHNEVS